ncbi:hypothetical protein L3Y34_014912 [Caenorhabditis briggsae]|uniref:Uncharacterized protein n=1 Tax=Caenorhabditis briggsae TaxID=6238 RepID=A0AAE9DT48_CAEBR|nr:hypothetical protein L3Y34_014912 [Caenorhabditis briggsae]
MHSPIIGIDFGTTKCCVAVVKDGTTHLIPNEHNEMNTPTCLAFTDTLRLIGKNAKDQILENAENTLIGFKRLIKEKPPLPPNCYYRPDPCYRNIYRNNVIWNVRPEGQINYRAEKLSMKPEVMTAMMLEQCKIDAEKYLGTSVKDAVLSIPSHFNDYQRQVIKQSATIAGLSVRCLASSSILGALDYGTNLEKKKEPRIVLVFDMGGGYFDFGLVRIENETLTVLGTSGGNIGGEDYLNQIVWKFVEEIKSKHENNFVFDANSVQRLRSECEKVKIALSKQNQVSISIDALFEGIDFRSSISRYEFYKLTYHLNKQIIDDFNEVLNSSSTRKEKIDEVILIGGASQMHEIRRWLFGYCQPEQFKCLSSTHSIARGAAIQGARLANIFVHKSLNVVGSNMNVNLFVGDGESQNHVPSFLKNLTMDEMDRMTDVLNLKAVCSNLMRTCENALKDIISLCDGAQQQIDADPEMIFEVLFKKVHSTLGTAVKRSIDAMSDAADIQIYEVYNVYDTCEAYNVYEVDQVPISRIGTTKRNAIELGWDSAHLTTTSRGNFGGVKQVFEKQDDDEIPPHGYRVSGLPRNGFVNFQNSILRIFSFISQFFARSFSLAFVILSNSDVLLSQF